MARVRLTLVALNLISAFTLVLGDAVAFFPAETRSANQFQYINPQFLPLSRNAIPNGYVLSHDHVIPQESMEPQENMQSILHTGKNLIAPSMQHNSLEGLNMTGNEATRGTEDDNRAAKSGYDYPTHPTAPYPQAPPYGYSPPAPSYNAPPSAPTAPSYAPSAPTHPPTSKISFFKPDLTSLIKPVTTKVAGKVSGLIGLVLSLLTGSAPDDLEMSGFKELVINGIVKPLLVAKGGIKSLISKLTIPVISLLLINLEVLITVWWLWEECPVAKPTYEYTKPTYNTPEYNSYR